MQPLQTSRRANKSIRMIRLKARGQSGLGNQEKHMLPRSGASWVDGTWPWRASPCEFCISVRPPEVPCTRASARGAALGGLAHLTRQSGSKLEPRPVPVQLPSPSPNPGVATSLFPCRSCCVESRSFPSPPASQPAKTPQPGTGSRSLGGSHGIPLNTRCLSVAPVLRKLQRNTTIHGGSIGPGPGPSKLQLQPDDPWTAGPCSACWPAQCISRLNGCPDPGLEF